MSTPNINDLTQHPPRSPRSRLGGYVILPRILDKARAKAAGKSGEYDYPGPSTSASLTSSKLIPKPCMPKSKLARAMAKFWSGFSRTPVTNPPRGKFSMVGLQRSAWPRQHSSQGTVLKAVTALALKRTDILTGFDLLELDDYVSFGGKA